MRAKISLSKTTKASEEEEEEEEEEILEFITMAVMYRGLRFLPTDDELFFHYLMPRLHREPLPDPDVVRDCDVYGGGDPRKIFGKEQDQKFYVFTMLKKKSKSRVDRTAGSGTWRGEQSYEIRGSQGEVVGYKKLFTFALKASSSAEANKADNGHWIMYEYSKHPHNDTDCVLCVISNKYAEEASKKAVGICMAEQRSTNADDVPCAASPLSTPAATQAQPAASLPFNEHEVVVPQNICRPTSLDFAGDGNLNSHVAAATKTMPKDSHCAADFLAFGGANGGPPSTTSVAVPVLDWEWANQLKNMEFTPSVKYLLCEAVKDRARALHAMNDLRVEFQPICPPPGRVPANYWKN